MDLAGPSSAGDVLTPPSQEEVSALDDLGPATDLLQATDLSPSADSGASRLCPPSIEPEETVTVPDGACEPQEVSSVANTITETVEGSQFIYTSSDEPMGLLVVFHGGGGSAMDAYTRVEAAAFVRDAVAAGFAVASLDSVAHLDPPSDGKFKWDEDRSVCNPDVQNVVRLIRRMKDPADLGVVPPAAPIFALGISNGGSMTSRAAQHIDFSAVSTHISNAKVFHEDDARLLPVAIVAGTQDETVGTEGPCLLYQKALDQGVEVSFHTNVPEALSPGLFTRMPGVDCTLSRAIIEGLEAGGALDDGMLLANPSDVSTWRPHLPAEAQAIELGIRDLLLERYAEHAFTSDFNEEVLRFFMDHAQAHDPTTLPSCDE